MNIVDYYRKLDLNLGVSLGEVKVFYWWLVRMYYFDVNLKDKYVKDKFIVVIEVYKILLRVVFV